MIKKRTYLDIIAEILSAAGVNEGAKKTHIMYRVNLSYNQLHYYLNFLTELNLLETVELSKSKVYKITNKGKEFLKEYEKIGKILTKSST